MDVRLRPATLRDLRAIVEANAAMAIETEGKRLDPAILERGVAALLADPARGAYIVAEADGAIVGQLMITTEWSDWRNAHFWWIQSVRVDPGWRGRGIYRRLHEEAARRAREAGACGLRLYVARDNTGAQEVYRRLGMDEAGYLLFETEF